MKYRIFISSVQREFVRERKAIADYIRRDALFGKFFEVFIFEETPAASVSAQSERVRRSFADLKRAHSSLPPNELLALPMYLKGAIEKTGTGTEDMVKQCRSWGLADPEFTDGPDFRIVIRRQVSGANRTVPTVGDDPANVPANGTMDGTINGTLALRIVSVLTKSPSTTLDQLAKRLNVARRSLVRYMNILQNNNRIRRVGGKRFGHWEVLDSQSE